MYMPSEAAIKSAHVSGMDAYNALCAEADADYEGYWARLARELLSWKTSRSPRCSTTATRRSSSGSKTAR
jgi:hypothetical protein